MRRITVNKQYEGNAELRGLIERLPEAFAQHEGELIYDKRNQVRRFVLGNGMRLMVKQFRQPNVVQQLCYSTFWTNKAEKSFAYGSRLESLGIGTPQAVASVVYKKGGLVTRYYFVAGEDEGCDCEVWIASHAGTPEWQQGIEALARFLAELHEKGFLHGDANLSNFRIHPQDAGQYRFAVIDTNRSTFLDRPASRKQRMANLCRISHNRVVVEALAKAYGRQCGYDEEMTYKEVLAATERFEQHKNRIRKLKRLFK